MLVDTNRLARTVLNGPAFAVNNFGLDSMVPETSSVSGVSTAARVSEMISLGIIGLQSLLRYLFITTTSGTSIIRQISDKARLGIIVAGRSHWLLRDILCPG
jgi:hypothetical protein